MGEIKGKIQALVNALIPYDYMLFGAIFLVFFLLIIFALILRRKKVFSLFLSIFSFIFLLVAPFVGYPMMHKELFKNELVLKSEKKLEYTKAVVVFGTLSNIAKRDFKSCLITASVHKKSSNKYKNYIYRFKSIQKMSIIKEDIQMGDVIDFKIIVEPFTYTKKYTILLEAKCK